MPTRLRALCTRVSLPICIIASCLLTLGNSRLPAANPQSSLPDRFRDVKMYSFSHPSAKAPGTIEVTTKVRNEGKKPLDIHATLKANDKAGFTGSEFKKTVAPGEEALWHWHFTPSNLRREILHGTVSFGDVVDRDLMIAIEGRDPANFESKQVEKITDSAAVVATYLPRKSESIRASRTTKSKPAPVLTLASQGKTSYFIITPESLSQQRKTRESIEQWAATPNLKEGEADLLLAVADLQRCINLKTGALPPVVESKGPSPAIRLVIDAHENWKHADGYQLKTADHGDVVIRSGTMVGLRNGIYALLTQHLDCHWFQPGKLGEEVVIPADKTIRLPKLDETSTPSFVSANGTCWSASKLWDFRNRSFINNARLNFGHSWEGYINPASYPYEKHPDMYARDREGKIRKRDNGWTWTNFCSTNPQVIEIVAKKVNERINGNKDVLVVSLDPNDYAPMCLCDRCLALDKQYGQKKENGEEVADRLLHFSKQIYDRLEPKNKHAFLGILIYGYQMELPISAKAHDHHAGTICNFPTRYDHTRPINDPTSPKNRHFQGLLKGWGAQLKQLGYYDYYGHWYLFGPWVMTHKMREDLPLFRDLGGTFCVLECQPNFASQGINHYISGQLMWNVDADVDELMDEFFEKYYGPAEVPMRNYWRGAERFFALTRSGTHAERAAYDPAFWTELAGYLAEAEKAVSGSNVAQRFKDRVTFAKDGLEYGLAIGKVSRETARSKITSDEQRQRILQDLIKGDEVEKRMFKKYGTGDYYPPFLPTYFWPGLEKQIEKFKKTGSYTFLEDA